MCIRGSRSRSKHPCVPPAADLAVAGEPWACYRFFVYRASFLKVFILVFFRDVWEEGVPL